MHRMTTDRSRIGTSPRLRGALAATALLPLLAGIALAAEPPYGSYGAPGPYGSAQPAAQGPDIGGRRLDLSIGRSAVIELPRDAKEVFVANPGIANAVVRSARKMFLIGVSNGVTSVFAMDADGRQISSFEVVVGRDLNVLRTTIRTAIPSARIIVQPAGDSILLTGVVNGAGDAQQAVDIARAFVGQSGAAPGSGAQPPTSGQSASGPQQSGGGQLQGGVINAITISGRDQVMIKVSVVEMARTAVKQLGVNVGGNWNVIDTAATAAGTAIAKANPASELVGFATGILVGRDDTGGLKFQGQAGVGNGANIGGTLQALERAGLSRILAEPTLVAISGESATFLAGGEIPIPINSCSSGNGGINTCVPTITYKPYGVSLGFTPIVMSEGRISLRVSTEVNEIDRDGSVLISGTQVPGFRTRKTSTTIELPSGGTMVTAGLISSQSNQTITGIPGLINLPILGALFRSRDFQRRDSELMIMVTPYLAKPMEAAQVVRPDDGFQEATDPQTVLLGRLNRLYGVSGPGGIRKGAAGRFGFITD